MAARLEAAARWEASLQEREDRRRAQEEEERQEEERRAAKRRREEEEMSRRREAQEEEERRRQLQPKILGFFSRFSHSVWAPPSSDKPHGNRCCCSTKFEQS